ncbi:MAG: endonuclease/exonuclease/phosphatase family protein [Anaerolineae bacterium]
MQIMTFNVRGSFHDDGDNDWEKRKALNIATLRSYAPDIFGIQEAQSGNLDAYAAELPEYEVEEGPISIRLNERYHRVPIYWKRDRYQRVDGGGFYLSETPDEFSHGWGADLARAVTWVRLNDGRTDFVVLNTHFHHETDFHHGRAESARLIVSRLSAFDVPHIVMADFNALSDSDAYHVFMEAGYVDSYSDGEPQPNTFHNFEGEAFAMQGVRIDWILTRGTAAQPIRALNCAVITDAEPPIYPSDHYPVMADLEML